MKFYYRAKRQMVESDDPWLDVREDGRVERLCRHGVGHPIGHTQEDKWDDKWMCVHGCDGCCFKAEYWLDNKFYETLPPHSD